MATSPLLGGTRAAAAAPGNDTNALGPSDNSDSGSDAQGAYGDGELASDSDAAGTGERATAGTGMERADADILPDHIEGEGGIPADEDGNPDKDTTRGVQAMAADEDVEDADAATDDTERNNA